jgi:hypothetical protein
MGGFGRPRGPGSGTMERHGRGAGRPGPAWGLGPAAEETAAVQQLAERGWAVSPGERFRFRAPPGIRIITTTSLDPAGAADLAAAISEAVTTSPATYAG